MTAMTMNGVDAIQELSFDEIDYINGGSDTADALKVTAAAAFTGTSVAARVGGVKVAAGLAVVGLVAYAAAEIID